MNESRTPIFRPQRGTREDSERDAVVVNSISELREVLKETFYPSVVGEITIGPYAVGVGGHQEYIVCVDGMGVGFTDSPLDYRP